MIRVLSIRAPYAEQILNGQKKIEYRTWKTGFRGRFAVHQSGGNIIGTVEIYAVEKHGHEYRWLLRNPKWLNIPIFAKGRLGFWKFRIE